MSESQMRYEPRQRAAEIERERDALKAENERLRAALAIYADPDNWDCTHEGWNDEWIESSDDGATYDGTIVARSALEPK